MTDMTAYISRCGGDTSDVRSRLESAGKAFGALRACVFSSTSVTPAAKRAVYERLVLAIGLFGCECWCLTEALWRELRCFHAQCLRAMCRVTRKHTWDHRVSTQELGQRLDLESIDAYVARRQARWLGHVSRMPWERLPRKMLSAWVPSAVRPKGAPRMTYGRSMKKSLTRLGIPFDSWPQLAADRQGWHATTTSRVPVPARAPPPQTPAPPLSLPCSPSVRAPSQHRIPTDVTRVLTPSPVRMGPLVTPPVLFSRPRRAVWAVPLRYT